MDLIKILDRGLSDVKRNHRKFNHLANKTDAQQKP